MDGDHKMNKHKRTPDRNNHGSDEFKNYRIGAVTVCKQ